MVRKLKVLISAYACEPGKGSEPNVGWQWALQMARFHDVTVVTRANNQARIEAALAGRGGPQFIYYDLPQWLLAWKHKGMPVVLYYILWQLGVRWKLRHRLKEFDLIHHVTFNTFMLPGFWWFCGRRVVIGPLGGGQVFPWRFLPLLGTHMLTEILRTLHTVSGDINPYLYLRFYFASKILVANPDTFHRIPHIYRHKVLQLLETGVAPDQFQEPKGASERSVVRLVSIGRLARTKGIELTLRAFARAWKQNNAIRLTFIGDGPDAARLRGLTALLGVTEAVEWRGWLAHAETRQTLARHDALIFTSLRDTSGNVILEAMACGLPVITLAHQGAAAITTDETALRVRPITIGQTIDDLAKAILRLAGSPELQMRLGRAGHQRVRDLYSWDAKGNFMNDVYQGLFPEHSPRRLKVLLSAYACEPGKGSEPLVGWQWALQIARIHDVTVVTRANNRPPIERALATYDGPQPRFIYYDLPSRVLTWKRGWLPIPIYYTWWEAAIRWRLRPQLGSFDLIHHISFNSYRWPGFWCFTGKPVILGPLGGGQVCPWRFLRLFGRRAVMEVIRSMDVALSQVNPHHYLTFFFPTHILIANQDTARRIPKVYRRKVRAMLETGIHPSEAAHRKMPTHAHGGRFIWIGGLEKRKALPLALRALARARQQDNALRLTIVGSGLEASALQKLAKTLGIGAAVQWAGQIPHATITELLMEHDALIFTSLRDTSGNVILEAMSAGLPVIALSHQGAAEITTDETAVRVRPTNIRRTIVELADGMLRLARDPGLRQRLGEAGRARALERYSWNLKGEMIDVIYRESMQIYDAESRRPTPPPGKHAMGTSGTLSLAQVDE
jgi:glycosyltransferase involved in cell wall biosynthesis